MSGINPFIPHNRKEQARQALMKLNKKPKKPKVVVDTEEEDKAPTQPTPTALVAQSLTRLSASMEEMHEAMLRLQRRMQQVGEREMLAAALRTYPSALRVQINDEDPVYVDSGSYEFQISTMLGDWGNFGMPQWVMQHFNESEGRDQQALKDYFASMPPNSVMTLKMFLEIVTQYFDHHYPRPDDNTFSSFNGLTMEQKDYYLPGLKVLHQDKNGTLWSPVYPVAWVDHELVAEHLHNDDLFFQIVGQQYHDHADMTEAMERCDCGIYASTNMEELRQYYQTVDGAAASIGLDKNFKQADRRVCIIEPFSDATVYIARKGWKASKAFVSEIVGDTISIADASSLMSMVWQRPMDLSSLFSTEE